MPCIKPFCLLGGQTALPDTAETLLQFFALLLGATNTSSSLARAICKAHGISACHGHVCPEPLSSFCPCRFPGSGVLGQRGVEKIIYEVGFANVGHAGAKSAFFPAAGPAVCRGWQLRRIATALIQVT